MITCIINGRKAYPISTSSIKVTYANQYVTDDGEYTYEIIFPMYILDNREIFKNVSRFEVKKSLPKFDECKLYVNGRIVMSGVGTIISVSDKEVKLQIVGGKSRIKFNEKMTKHYIDEIDLGKADAPGTGRPSKNIGLAYNGVIRDVRLLEPDQKEFLGVEGKWCFVPVKDETNDMIANFVGIANNIYIVDGELYPGIVNLAVQPNLMYIFKKVIEYEGYKITRNDLDVDPWNLLYIASAYKTLELRRALPHWTSYTFVEEFRKLFNATIYFDDIKRTCQIIRASELSTSKSVEIEPLDEYNTDFDADGTFTISATANLQYNLGSSVNRGDYRVIPPKVFKNFRVVDTLEAPWGSSFPETTSGWGEREKRTTIIRYANSDYYIYTEDTDGNRQWQLAGIWSPLIRDQESEDYIDLNISPAAQVVEQIEFKRAGKDMKSRAEWRYMLSVPNDKESEDKDCDVDEEGLNYVSVQDAIDDESAQDNEEDDQECMNIFFTTPGRVQKYVHPMNHEISWVGVISRWPHFITDSRINSEYRMELLSPDNFGSIDDNNMMWSLSLSGGWNAGTTLSSLHDGGLKIDNKNCLEVKFKFDGIPDPSSIFIIRNKKFVCEKIEVEVKYDGIEPIKTGYFYMLS